MPVRIGNSISGLFGVDTITTSSGLKLIPGAPTSILTNLKVTGNPCPGSVAVNGKFPGESTRMEVTTPTPSTVFGHGGGIRTAETPMGLSLHDKELSETVTVFEIFKANPVGFLLKMLTLVGIFVT